MSRIKQIEDEGNVVITDEDVVITPREPMVIKRKSSDDSNGIIPVLFDDAKVYYSSRESVYFAVIKIEGKKYRFEMDKC